MKLSTASLLSAVLLLGMNLAVAQNNHVWYPNGAYNGQNGQYNNADYQRGFQDGINSGRADANQNKPFNVNSHPYYTNSNNQAYREGFMQGYRDAYGQARGGYNNGQYGPYNGQNGPYNNGPYNGTYGNNNNAYQRGFQDGINSGRADASSNKQFNVDSHSYYRDSRDQAYREGFMKGYREGYGQTSGRNRNGSYNGNRAYNQDHYWGH